MSGFEDFPLISGSRYKPVVLAHRGDHRFHKPNSLPAITSSLNSGADGAEVDLRLGAEGGIFLSHDPKQKGYELAKAREEDLELEKLSICTLDKVLAATGEMLLNLELKSDPFGRVDELTDSVLAKCGPLAESKRLLFSSFDRKVIESLKSKAPEVKVSLLLEHRISLDRPISYAKELGLFGLNLHHRNAVGKPLARCLEAGLKVNVWTLDNEKSAIDLSYHPVTGIITNKIAEIRRVVG